MSRSESTLTREARIPSVSEVEAIRLSYSVLI